MLPAAISTVTNTATFTVATKGLRIPPPPFLYQIKHGRGVKE